MPAFGFIIFAVLAQGILFLAHWFVFKTIARFFAIDGLMLFKVLKTGFFVFSLSLVFASLLASLFYNILVRVFYNIAVFWLGFFYFFVLASLIVWLVFGAAKVAGLDFNKSALAIIVFGAAILAGVFGVLNASAIRVTQISVQLPNLPESWQGKKAVWVSDTHLGQVRGSGFAEKIVGLIKAQGPKIVFIGGDLFDGVAFDLDKLIKPFKDLSAAKGVYFITGNHEQFSDSAKYKEAVRRAGIKVLDNEMAEIDGLQIIGVDYQDAGKRDVFEEILKNRIKMDKFMPSILLKHTSLNLDIAQNAGISLQISGHSHQGQVFLFKYITQAVYKGYDFGLKNFGGMQVYTSSGAGTWGPPMRVDTKPEIVVINFQ